MVSSLDKGVGGALNPPRVASLPVLVRSTLRSDFFFVFCCCSCCFSKGVVFSSSFLFWTKFKAKSVVVFKDIFLRDDEGKKEDFDADERALVTSTNSSSIVVAFSSRDGWCDGFFFIHRCDVLFLVEDQRVFFAFFSIFSNNNQKTTKKEKNDDTEPQNHRQRVFFPVREMDETMGENGNGGGSETPSSTTSTTRFSQDVSFLLVPQNGLELVLTACLALFSLTTYRTFSQHPNELLKMHIFGMSGAFGVCLPLGALIAIKLRRFEDLRRTRALILHAFVQTLGMCCFSIGFFAIYENKVRKGSEHFTTVHSRFGMATLLVSVFGAVAFGVVGFRKTGVAKVAKMSEHAVAQTKKWHRNSGTTVVLLSWVTITLAFHHPAVTDATVNYILAFWYILISLAAVAFTIAIRGSETTRNLIV